MEEQLINAVAKGDLSELKKYSNLEKIERKVAEDLLIGATIGNFIDIVNFLLDNNISPDAKDKKEEWSVLHYAVDKCRIEVAKILIARGADVNIVDENGNSPLGNAIFNRDECPELISVLIKNGADIDLKNFHGVSARDLANDFDLDIDSFK